MAGIKVNMDVDPFFTDTRVKNCFRSSCKFNGCQSSGNTDDGGCDFKKVELDANGACMEYVRVEED